ncbi:hypothetical protein LRP52_06335 [Photobacterium sp. ZSDE20]|uniref:Lipoprotein n=1 Tax=Photobacterium pectinilyticum TaxID=2906793 RepID=A0ABT1N0P2_9GAMM|nr:hypothetical protein [Photobacterium sp. ZSDE20]MCQ1057479.1 hypothetical protein [Photobacterium sp. ZSDE20]MDD1821821.1 hypothetical protein [Photobacterium sp. ZSDE20]
MNKFTIASVAVATALLAGCGGSSSSSGDKDLDLPTGGEAEVCFNPTLWEDGTHEVTWRYDNDAYSTERLVITNGVDFDEHKSITQVESVYAYSETPLGSEVEAKSRRAQQSRSGQWTSSNFYVIDEQSTSVSYAGDMESNGVDFDSDVNSPAAPLWLFGSKEGETTPASYTTTWIEIEDGQEFRYTWGQSKRSVTFNGLDKVDVLGNEVNACSFTIKTTTDAEFEGEAETMTETLEHWIDKETGLLVKSVTLEEGVDIDGSWSDYEEKVLEQYSIDGEVIFSTEDEELPEA